MDHTTLHKKLSTYLSDKGRLKNLPDELMCEVLRAWEDWPGTSKDFYRSVGFSHRQMAGIIGKAKKLKRDGHFPVELFTEIKSEDTDLSDTLHLTKTTNVCSTIELEWQSDRVIRFPDVKQLVEFLKLAS